MTYPKVEVKDITPKEARELLSMNTFNRSVRRETVEKYKAAMREGRWRANGEPIKVGTDGVLKDGQHRLIAAVESNITLKGMVIVTVDEKEANCYDIGLVRNVRDVLAFEGVTEKYLTNSMITAGMNAILSLKIGRAVDKSLACKKLIENADACEFVYHNFITKRGARVTGIYKAGTTGALIAAYINSYDLDDLKAFCDALTTGFTTEPRDRTVICLRNWLISYRSKQGGGSAQKDHYCTTQAALKAFAQGRIWRRCSRYDKYSYLID